MNTEVMFSSDKGCWETPRALFEQLDAEFHFTLDAAASDENHKCGRYFTEKEDGLRQNWGGRDGVLQPSVRKPGNRAVDREMLVRGPEAGHNGGSLDPGAHGSRQFSRLHIGERGNTIFARAAEV